MFRSGLDLKSNDQNLWSLPWNVRQCGNSHVTRLEVNLVWKCT